MAHRGIKIFSIPEDFSNTTDALTSGQMQYKDIVMVKPTDYNFRMQIYQYLLGGPGGNIPYLEPLRPDDWRAIEESLSNSVGYYSQEDVEYTDNSLKFNVTPVRVAHQEDYRNLLNFLRNISVNKFGDFLEGNFNLTRSKLQWKNNNYASELFLDKGNGQFRLNITPQSRFAISRINPNFSTLNQPLVLIGGTVTEVYTDTKITGSLEVTSNELIRGNLIVNGSSSLKGTTDIGEDGGNLTVHREAEIKGKVSLNTNANSTTTVYGDFIANKNVTLNNSSGTTRIKGNTSTDGNFSIGNNLTVNGQTVFNNNVYFNYGDLYVSSGSIYAPNGDIAVGGEAVINGDLTVLRDARIFGELGVDNDCSLRGNVNVDKDLHVTRNTYLHGELNVEKDTRLEKDLFVEKNSLIQGFLNVKGTISAGDTLNAEKGLYVLGDAHLTQAVHVGHNLSVGNLLSSPWVDFTASIHGNTITNLNADMLDGHHWSDVLALVEGIDIPEMPIVPKNTTDWNSWWKCGDTGLIIQWGVYTDGGNGKEYFYPITFPVSCLFVISQVVMNASWWGSGEVYIVEQNQNYFKTAGGLSQRFIAIGY